MSRLNTMSRLKGLSSLMILSMVWRSWHRKDSIEIKTEISWFLEEEYLEGRSVEESNISARFSDII